MFLLVSRLVNYLAIPHHILSQLDLSKLINIEGIKVLKIVNWFGLVFDKDRSGFASSSEIKTVMANLGVHFTDEEIQEMMIEV